MLIEQDILDLHFVKEDYSTDLVQYYKINISREERYKQYDAHNEYILEIHELTEDNPHRLSSTLKLGQHYGTSTNGWDGTFTDKDHLDSVLEDMVLWDLRH